MGQTRDEGADQKRFGKGVKSFVAGGLAGQPGLDGRGALLQLNRERTGQCLAQYDSWYFNMSRLCVGLNVGQATKGARRMPWRHGPKKGVARLR